MATGTESRFQDMILKTAEVQVNGTPVYPSFPRIGKNWFVDAKNGSDGHDGLSWSRPLLTMGEAFDRLGSGDTIYFVGKVREQLTAPDGVFDVTIVGAGNRPRHADDHSESVNDRTRGSSASSWLLPTSPTASTPLLKVQNQGWRLANFLMQADTNQVCVDLITNSESGDDEYSAGHFSCYGMRFDGAGTGIRDNGPAGFVGIYDSFFRGMTTAIGEVAGAGPGTRSWWEIMGNRFFNNTNGINLQLISATITRNYVGPDHTKGIWTVGASAANNMVTGNYLMGDYDTLYDSATGDMWTGNWSDDTASDNVDAAGQTTAVPGT